MKKIYVSIEGEGEDEDDVEEDDEDESDCVDEIPTRHCENIKSNGKCEMRWAQEKCPATCGMCMIKTWQMISISWHTLYLIHVLSSRN